jgi:hypothetical protein
VNFDEEFEEEVKRNPAFRFDAPITSARVVRCARIIAHWANDRNKARDAQLSKEFKTLERTLGLIQQKIARSKLSDEQQKILIEEIDVAITRFEKLLLV